MSGLAIIETHPIQYHAPVYRHVQQALGLPVTAIYGSDFSVAGYRDREFGAAFAWDSDLLSGYTSVFLSRLAEGGARNDREVSASGLGGILKRLAPEAVLSVGYSPRFHFDAFRCARKTGRPILFRGETTDHAQQRGKLKNWVRDQMLRRLYGQCAALLSVGQRSREHFRRLGVEDSRLFFSPYCVDTAPFRTDEEARAELRETTRKELGIGSEQVVIGFSGKLSLRKAPQLLAEAVRNLPEVLRGRCLALLVGDGELKASLVTQAATAPAVPLNHVGFQNQRALSRYYHAMDVLVLPSLHSETWGLVVNEALHHGVPTVVSQAVGCGPDLVTPGQTGEIFATGSAPSLAGALSRVCPLLGSVQARATCRARAGQYSVARAAEGIAAAYRAVTSPCLRG